MAINQNNRSLPGERSAGLLLHITSLPGKYGIGDLGPEAYAFADFLQRSAQRYWQVLPVNPIDRSNGYSPYSSVSSRAGNALLISPDLLVKKGLLAYRDLRKARLEASDIVDFEKAEHVKKQLLQKAYGSFYRTAGPKDKKQFKQFCETERTWLDDYASFVLLRDLHGGKNWNEWEVPYRDRHKKILISVAAEHETRLNEIKWQQFEFFSQWQAFRNYCNSKAIRLFGDIPFYVSYNSADVWSAREFFRLDSKGLPTFVAGVPPDYFNKDGQLWGMPVFNWSRLKRDRYSWWVNRIDHNLRMFELVRLDHFRAFADYWAIPMGEKTARNGKWLKGPGSVFFDVVRQAIGRLPFVAEDLGDIDEPVRQLRASFQLPGMKVLQFAFGGDINKSEHIPHNYSDNFVVYTGTHDNNTTRGWFGTDLKKSERANVKRYLGTGLSEENVHLELTRLAYASVAQIAIIPVQDLLGLNKEARFNSPATLSNNWKWRLKRGTLTPAIARWLNGMVDLYNR